MTVSWWTLLRMRNVSGKCCRESKISHFIVNNIFPKIIMFMSARALSLSLSLGATARGGPRPPSRVSSIHPGLGRLFSNFYALALLQLPPLLLPNAAGVTVWGAFLLAHWGGLSWINHRRPGVWHALPISVYSACRISQSHSHHTVGRVLG